METGREGEEGRQQELTEVLRGVAGGVAMKCLAESNSGKNDQARYVRLSSDATIVYRCEQLWSTLWLQTSLIP